MQAEKLNMEACKLELELAREVTFTPAIRDVFIQHAIEFARRAGRLETAYAISEEFRARREHRERTDTPEMSAEEMFRVHVVAIARLPLWHNGKCLVCGCECETDEAHTYDCIFARASEQVGDRR